jgi:hypothetical protein
MDKITHTPTPWYIREYNTSLILTDTGLELIEYQLKHNKSDYEIVTIHLDSADNGKANAEYICRAVNSHEGLVEAVRIALLVIEDMHHRAGFHGNEQGRYLEIKEALKAADGEV